MNTRPSQVYGFDGLEGYCFDTAVVLWGTAFDAAIQEAVVNAKGKDKDAGQRAADRVIRRWIPAARVYADPKKA